MMKSMFERRTSFDEEEASSVASLGSNSSEGSSRGSNYLGLGRLFGGAQQPQRPASPTLGNQTIIPQYKKENRMLMRSPLPSPTATIRKKIVKPHVRSSEDSDSEEITKKQKEREEAHVSRLVHMAKAQQNLMTAWFAASAGAESVMLGMPRQRPKQARRQSSSGSAASKSSSGSVSGPVDLDSMTPWDGKDEGGVGDDAESLRSQSSTGSSKLRRFLGGILGTSSSVANAPDQPSVMTGETQRVKNTSTKNDQNNDVEMASLPSTADESNYVLVAGKWRCTWNRIILCMLATIFIIALISVVASYATKLSSGDKRKSGSVDESASGDEVFITSPPFTLRLPTGSPSFAPSLSPSNMPSIVLPSLPPSISAVPSTPYPSVTPTTTPSLVPSVMPSTVPSTVPSDQPSLLPSLAPSGTPSLTPTASPSLVPSSMPSILPTTAPSVSLFPSLSPTSAPSTIFSTTTFSSLGQGLLGQQSSEQFGYSTSLSGDGTILVTGARYYNGAQGERVGRVEVYTRSGEEWTLMGQPMIGRNAQDQFGFSVALSDDGLTLAASEPGYDVTPGDKSGNVRVFAWDASIQQWSQLGLDINGEEKASLFGVSISLSADGSRIAVGSPYHDGAQNLSLSGQVRVFEINTSNNQWQAVGQPLDGTRSLDWFGWSVDLSADGQRVAAGAPRNRDYGGFVRCFDFDGVQWDQVGDDIINDQLKVHVEDRFGMSISLDGDRLAIGSPWKDSASGTFTTGMVAIFEWQGSDWSILGSPMEGETMSDQMGMSVELRGEYLSVGSPGAFSQSGMVTFYRYDGSDWDMASAPLIAYEGHTDFGLNLSIDRDAKTLVVGSPATTSSEGLTGAVEVFLRKLY